MWSSNSASHSYLYRLSWTPLNPITVFVLFRYIQGEGDCPGRVGGGYKSDGDACHLSYGCKLQIVVPLRVFGMESHCICSFGYRLELCIKIFPKRLWCLLVWSPLEVSLSLSEPHRHWSPLRGLMLFFQWAAPLLLYGSLPQGELRAR